MNERTIDDIQLEWGRMALQRGLKAEDLMNCAGHFLANILLSIAQNEAAAHELMNRITEANHLYINTCWPDAKAKRDVVAQAVERASREGL